MIHHPSSQADGHADLTERVHAEIAAVLDLMPQDVQPDADLRENYGLSEWERTALRVALGVTFKVFAPIEVANAWQKPRDITAYVESRLAATDRIAG